MKRSVEEYLNLPYTIEVTRDTGEQSDGWFARVVELPGCMTQADSFDEIDEMVTDAMRAWIETALELGREIPEPGSDDAYSGKFVIRTPKSLHRALVEAAASDGVSLNAFVNVTLARAVGVKR